MDLDVDIENEKIKEIEKIKKSYDDKEANFYIYILKNSKEDVEKNIVMILVIVISFSVKKAKICMV